MTDSGEVTKLLVALGGGGHDVTDEIFALVYDELHRVASAQMARERADHTLGATALVHETYVRLAGTEGIEWKSRAHFFAIAARAMRRILINHAEARSTAKRGGDWQKVQLDPGIATVGGWSERILALDEALEGLAELDPRQCRVVECRYFAGMTVEETSTALEISAATVKRDWTMARAWLNRALAE